MNRQKKVHQPHDKGYKYILTIKQEFLKLLKGFIQEKWVDTIKEENIVRIDKSFIDTHFQGKEADIVYRYKNGEDETIFYILLEHQSTVDNKMMFRLLTYMMEIWRYYINENKISIAPQEESEEQDKKHPPFKIPAIIPIVLHTGPQQWKAPTAFKEIIKESERFNEHIVNFNSLLIDTSQIGDETFLKQKSVIALVMYLDKAKSFEDFLKKYPIIAMIFNQLSPQEKRMLTKWVNDIFKQRFDQKTVKKIERILEEKDPTEVKKMITNLERVIKREQDQRYNEGRIEGREEGRKEERKEREEERKETAINFYKMGLTLDQIAQGTGIDKEKLKEILKDVER
jgi:predicted transposase YdaD